VATIAQLLRVKEEILHQALISKRARASGETLVINYRMPEVRNIRTSVSIFCFLSNILHPFSFSFLFCY
jgi:myosin-9